MSTYCQVIIISLLIYLLVILFRIAAAILLNLPIETTNSTTMEVRLIYPNILKGKNIKRL